MVRKTSLCIVYYNIIFQRDNRVFFFPRDVSWACYIGTDVRTYQMTDSYINK